MPLRKHNLPPAESPDDLMTGRCPSCKVVVECRRRHARPPDTRQRLPGRQATETFGAQYDCWSIECPHCVHKGMRVTSAASGEVAQVEGGPRVYLIKKSGT